jgi:hypothetical protein
MKLFMVMVLVVINLSDYENDKEDKYYCYYFLLYCESILFDIYVF